MLRPSEHRFSGLRATGPTGLFPLCVLTSLKNISHSCAHLTCCYVVRSLLLSSSRASSVAAPRSVPRSSSLSAAPPLLRTVPRPPHVPKCCRDAAVLHQKVVAIVDAVAAAMCDSTRRCCEESTCCKRMFQVF
jgi:hypothetical protein